MTRLTQDDLWGVGLKLADYDLSLIAKTNLNLKQIACHASGIKENIFNDKSQDNLIAVIPISGGEGLIDGFTQSVCSIIQYLGFKAFITEETDVSGIAEGIAKEADILFMADDNRFIAFDKRKGNVIDNAKATGRGYAAALNGMAGGLSGKEVLVIGAGKVGKYAIEYFKQFQAKIAVFDINSEKTKNLSKDISIELNFREILPKYKYILEATPQGGGLKLELLHPEAVIAAPGIPMGLSPEAYEVFSNKVVHDPLQIGVATMLAMVLL